MIFNKDFVNEITFWLRYRKKIWWKERMCATWKFELKKDLCEIKKMWKYPNIKITNSRSIKWGSWTYFVTYWFEKIMDVSIFILYFQFWIFCRSWFKFLIGNFTTVRIRNFFPDWETEFLKQLGPHRYFSGNLWNWWKNKVFVYSLGVILNVHK